MAVILFAGAIPDLPDIPLHEVHILINPSKLWATIKLLSPSVMIVHENLPRPNAKKLCRDIKLNESTQHIAVIVLSEETDFSRYANVVVQRPPDAAVLLAAIHKVLPD